MPNIRPALLALALAAACSPAPPRQADSGVRARPEMARYLGTSVVVDTETQGDVTTHHFADDADQRCLRGAPYRLATRDQGADDLVIFLQGGGACWDDFCLAVTTATTGVPPVDILAPDLADNPVADWNATYLPYCDGSLFVGDRDWDEDGDGTPDRYHRGLANLSAALDVSKAEFPSPRRVLFAGSSGGGFGVTLATPLVRLAFPDAEITVLADSAVGVARGSANPAFVTELVEDWGAAELLPEGCEDCLDDGHMTGVLDHYLAEDPGLRVGVFTAWYDLIIGDLFLDLEPADFQAEVESETAALHAAWPDRYRRFIIDGRMHTTLLGDVTGGLLSDPSSLELPDDALGTLARIELGSLETTTSADGTRVADWVAGLVESDARWTDLVDPPGPAPEASDR